MISITLNHSVIFPPFSNLTLMLSIILSTPCMIDTNHTTVFQPWNLHIAVAFSESHAQTFSRAFNKTINNVTRSFMENYHQHNVTLSPLIITLPENQQFSASILENTCMELEGKPIAAVLIIGKSPAGFAVTLAAATAGIPVLWARGGTGELLGHFQSDINKLEVRLEPTVREVLEALRALLLATHWHSYTVLADSPGSSGMLLRPDLASILKTPPLNPKLLVLQSGAGARHSIFRRLADISRSTRGVIVLLCDMQTAVWITSEAKRLNMMSGHFVWLWIDTSASTPLENTTRSNNTSSSSIHQVLSNLKSKSPPNKRRERETEDLSQWDSPSNNSNIFVGPYVTSSRNTRSDVAASGYIISNSQDSGIRLGTDYLKKNFKSSILLGEDKTSDVTFRDFKLKPETMQSSGWVFPEGKSGWNGDEDEDTLPTGLLALRTQAMKLDRQLVKGTVRLLADTLRRVLTQCADWMPTPPTSNNSCWDKPSDSYRNFSAIFTRELQGAVRDVLAGRRDQADRSLVASFNILNLVPENAQSANDSEQGALVWRTVGEVTGRTVRLDTIVWPGGDLVVAGLSPRARSVFRIVTALAPPFVMEGELDEDGQCLRGLPCHRVLTSDKDNLTLVFNEMETHDRLEEEEEDEEELALVEDESVLGIPSVKKSDQKSSYRDSEIRTVSASQTPNPQQQQPWYKTKTNCCYGLAMDLLENVAHELEFDFHLYIVSDGLFGTKTRHVPASGDIGSEVKWNGIVGDLVSGAAHMSFAALSVSSARSEVVDFSVPYFFSGVSFLAAPTQTSEVPLLAFLLPFSIELWVAIFTSLNITAMAVAVYEWLSPFGLNPWGRQRTKNFSIASALWVMWGLLCGHLVAFKAPKSWPNKFLINIWGGFSVIFVASYTANIAALIAGLFFHNTVGNYHDRSLLSQRVGAPRASAADYYVHRTNQHLWEHMQKYSVRDVEEGIQHLKNGSLEILIADTPILDYYRATDHGCKLQKVGDAINEDTYAVGMTKGFPLKDSISSVIAKYSSNGYMDILTEKWYGALPCFKLETDMAQPRPLGVAAVAGVFLLLGLGMVLGCLILLFEHLFYRYTLPVLRHQPKGTIWRSRNIMFFSQKLYRFINCVELVSPHHAARELVHTIRQGQITSLFQKSVKRKEHEQRRRRKSKAQFFEMIQEIRRVQQEERVQEDAQPNPETPSQSDSLLKPSCRFSRDLLSPLMPSKSPLFKSSPRNIKKSKSPRALETRKFYKQIFSPRGSEKSANNNRRFSSEMVFSPLQTRLDCPSNAVGRRLSKDSDGCHSPPDINSRRCSNLDVSSRHDKLSTLDLRFQKGKSNLDVRLPDTRASGSNLHTIPRPGSSSNTNVKHDFRLRSSIQERLNTIGSRLGSVSTTDITGSTRKLSTSPIPSMFNVNSLSPRIPKYRDRVRSDTTAIDRTPSATEIEVAVIEHSATTRSHSLDTPQDENQHLKLKRTEYSLPYESIIEVNVTCCDSTPEKIPDNSPTKPSRTRARPSTSHEQLNVSGSSPTPYSSLKKAQFRRRQSHQPRLETVYTPQHKVASPTSSSQSSSKDFLVPIQRHENSSSSSSSRSPVRRRHQSHPARSEQETSAIAASSSIPDISSTLSPSRQKHHRRHRHRSRDSSHECDEVFDEIPPPPPPPSCPPRNGSNGESPLDRLNKEELVALWRSSESELRSTLLRAIRAKQVPDPP